MTCAWPCGCMLPPITPKLITGLSVLGDEAGDDGLERALARPHLVRMARLQRERVRAILQADAGARHHHARAEAHVIRLDEGHHHAARIGGGEIDRAALRRRAVVEVLRALQVDQLRARGEIGRVEQFGVAHRHGLRIGHVAVDVGERELSSPRSAGARCRPNRPDSSPRRNAAGCPAPSARRCPGRWAAVRAGCSRGSPAPAARPSPKCARRNRPRSSARHAASRARRFCARFRRGKRLRRAISAISSSVFAWSGKLNFSPGSGARPFGMKASLKPGCACSSGTWLAHCLAMVGETR